MVMISFRNKEEKEHLLEKAKKMEEYASMIVDCIKESKAEEYNERYYRGDEEDEVRIGRHIYKRMPR